MNDFALLPFADTIETVNQVALAHVSYADMAPDAVMSTYQYGTIKELFLLNIHHLIWKWLSYIPSGRLMITLGIFLLGYYLASIHFFTEKSKSTYLLMSSLIIGLLTTVSAQLIGGNQYQFPPTLINTLYKSLLTTGQISLAVFYLVSISRILQTARGKRVLSYLKPVGRMALTNYVFQTIICLLIFYNFGFNLIGETGLVYSVFIAFCVLILQIVLSNIWLQYYRFGPLEWLWRSLTYKKRIKIKILKV